MVTYDELANTNLSALDTVATDFEQLVRKWEYESDFQGDVLNPLSASGWSGPAAQAAVGQLTQARTQIEAAFNETSALAKALRDAHDQFAACQKTLHQIQQDAQTQGLTISADGTQVTWTMPPDLPHNAGVREEYRQGMDQEAANLAQRLKTVLQQATEADQAAAAALAADTGTNQQSFNAAPVGGIPEEEAAQAAALASQGNNLTNAQLAQLDALLKAHANDPAFSTAFYRDLGPQGTLKFWGQLSEGSTGLIKPDQARLDILTDMQTQLGTSLASATNTQNWPHLSDQWEAGLRAAGAQRIQLAGPDDFNYQPYGYQILGSILRTGNYDPRFLDPIAEHVTQLTQKNPDMWAMAMPQPPCPDVKTNFLGGGSGFNPVSSILEGLGHSPAAATDFFHNPETLYNADGTPSGHTAPNGYLNFLTDTDKNRTFADVAWPNQNSLATAAAYEPTALGHALQAGTTGVAWDAPNGTPLPQHTEATNDVMRQVVDKFGGNPSLIQGDGAPFRAMNGSLANMTASYIGDVNQAVSFPAGSHLSVFGAPANLDQNHTFGLVDALGQDPGSYGTVQQAQNGYLAGQIQNEAHQPGDVNANLARVASQGGQVDGILANGRARGVAQAGWASDAAYNQAIDSNTGIANTIYSQTVGGVVGKVPILGDIANDQVSGMITDIGNSYHHDSTAQSISTNTDIVTSGKAAAAQAAQDATRQALLNTGLDPAGQTTANVGQAAEVGFAAGLGLDLSVHQGDK
ncbi:hypothetical protein C7C46_13200 [Streptomyces tateyamensis]|uniref:Uncharacterized protein n=1 Tax=Streptomyces tateyamensis TaxID=565073 RepID=A0A2V4NEH5_9ACTN|nr:hypothetical protein [Streptomyces tateyamensis]PYC80239.1 hypothetical protein C7C46_13200 [Streptomyces tateyamensis]